MEAKLRIPEEQRADIADRMALLAEQLARHRASMAGKAVEAPEGTTR